MPSVEDHRRLAERNRSTLNYLKREFDAHLEWVVTVAFYEALHWVEVIFACDDFGQRPKDHYERTNVLQQGRYRHLYGTYKKLQDASLVARYMEFGELKFSEYMSKTHVEVQVINSWLSAIRSEAAGRLARRSQEPPPAAPP